MKKNLSPWGKAVKIELINRDWSNQDLADATNLSREYVCAVINERVISPSAIKAISAALGIAEPASSLERSIS